MKRSLTLFLFLNELSALGITATVGYTTRDLQLYGPGLLRIYNDTVSGVHFVWKDEIARAFYNFFDRTTSSFRWQNGKNIFSKRVTLGNLAINPRNRCIQIVANYFDNNQYLPVYAVDSPPGEGNFTEYVLRPDFKWSVLTVINYGYARFLSHKTETLYYSSAWSKRSIGYYGCFPTHNITAALDTSKVAILWTATISPWSGILFIRTSRNGGESWTDTIALSRLIPSDCKNTFLGGYGFYDKSRKLHIVTNTYDGSNRYRAELWHCLQDTIMVWSQIYAAGTNEAIHIDNYALYAGRPSIGQNPRTGDLFVCWEQFDSLSYEPSTGLARACIWASRSTDNGLTWGKPVCLTVPDQTSKRFPSLAPVVNDTLHLTYMIDSIAGFWEQGQGRKTKNPIIYHRVPAESIPVALTEQSQCRIPNSEFRIRNNPMRSYLKIEFGMQPPEGEIQIYDITGKLVKSFPVNTHRIVWNGTDDNGRPVKSGIYFGQWVSKSRTAQQKIVVVR